MEKDDEEMPDLLLPNVPSIGKNIYANPIDNEVLYSHLIFDENRYSFEQQKIEESFLEAEVADPSYIEDKKIDEYVGSDYRSQLYKTLSTKDKLFSKFLKGYFGSEENFSEFTESLNENKTYDPSRDQQAEIVIITKENYFKAGYISQIEVLLELLSGICTIEYMRVNGRADRLICTLSEDLIPQSQEDIRYDAFSGLPGKRILVWDLIKGGWASFYLQNLIRFVRDDTSGIQ